MIAFNRHDAQVLIATLGLGDHTTNDPDLAAAILALVRYADGVIGLTEDGA